MKQSSIHPGTAIHQPTLDEYLITPDESGWTPLHDSARYGPCDVFITLVNRASEPALDQALILKHLIMHYMNQPILAGHFCI